MPPTAVRKPAAAQAPGFNFGDLSNYAAGGFTLPEGDYALYFDILMHAFTKQSGQRGVERLMAKVTAFPLAGGEAQETYYSMGSKAHLSFAPDPNTGKGVVPIPGGPAAMLPPSTNWMFLLKSLYDCGLPPGIFTNDLSVIDGIHVHMVVIPEPEERKSFGGSKTGEADDEPRTSGTIAVVGSIMEDGKPWEGGGGLPEGAIEPGQAPAPKPAPAARTAAARPAAAAVKPGPAVKPATRAAAKPAPAPEPAGEDEGAVEQSAISVVSGIIEANPVGLPKLTLRTKVFKALEGEPETAQAVMETYFSSDDVTNGLLGQFGWGIVGVKAQPTA